jgi:dihydrofolate reductase
MIKMIAAVSKNGIIGIDNKIPWNYPEDMKHFRLCTSNSTVVMGRKTFESIGKPLPKRKNIVIASKPIDMEGIETVSSLEKALISTDNFHIWLIGGAGVYQEGMSYADEIHLTLTPDIILGTDVIKFPWINPTIFTLNRLEKLSAASDSKLQYAVWIRQ